MSTQAGALEANTLHSHGHRNRPKRGAKGDIFILSIAHAGSSAGSVQDALSGSLFNFEDEGLRSSELVALDCIANELKFVLMDAQLYEFSARSLSAGK
jgi:hypothetical protein